MHLAIILGAVVVGMADGLALRSRAPPLMQFGGASFKNPFANKQDGATTMAVTLLFRCEDRGRGSILGQVSDLASSADTASPDGIADLCGDTALALLRQYDRWLQCSTSAEHKGNDDDALRIFDVLAIQEASKFDGLEKSDTIDAALAAAGVGPGGAIAPPTNCVLCVLACLMGDREDRFSSKASSGNSADAKAALTEMAAAANGDGEIFAFELFWVPGSNDEVVDMDQVALDWPELMPC